MLALVAVCVAFGGARNGVPAASPPQQGAGQNGPAAQNEEARPLLAQPGQDINAVLQDYLVIYHPEDSPPQISIAPMSADNKGSPTPPPDTQFTPVDNTKIYDGIIKRAGISTDKDPTSLAGNPGVLDLIGTSNVLNDGGTRATFGYFIKTTLRDGTTVYHFALFSYDKINTTGSDGATKPLTATEFFLFGGFQVRGATIVPNPPELLYGLAIGADGKLLSEVPLSLAAVSNHKNRGHEKNETVKPGVEEPGKGCLVCHAREADGLVATTTPFPWVEAPVPKPPKQAATAPEAAPAPNGQAPPPEAGDKSAGNSAPGGDKDKNAADNSSSQNNAPPPKDESPNPGSQSPGENKPEKKPLIPRRVSKNNATPGTGEASSETVPTSVEPAPVTVETGVEAQQNGAPVVQNPAEAPPTTGTPQGQTPPPSPQQAASPPAPAECAPVNPPYIPAPPLVDLALPDPGPVPEINDCGPKSECEGLTEYIAKLEAILQLATEHEREAAANLPLADSLHASANDWNNSAQKEDAEADHYDGQAADAHARAGKASSTDSAVAWENVAAGDESQAACLRSEAASSRAVAEQYQNNANAIDANYTAAALAVQEASDQLNAAQLAHKECLDRPPCPEESMTTPGHEETPGESTEEKSEATGNGMENSGANTAGSDDELTPEEAKLLDDLLGAKDAGSNEHEMSKEEAEAKALAEFGGEENDSSTDAGAMDADSGEYTLGANSDDENSDESAPITIRIQIVLTAEGVQVNVLQNENLSTYDEKLFALANGTFDGASIGSPDPAEVQLVPAAYHPDRAGQDEDLVPGSIVRVVRKLSSTSPSPVSKTERRYSLVANGASSGEALELQVFDPSGKVKNVAMREGIALEPLEKTSARPVAEAAPKGVKVVSKPITIYCAEYSKAPPEPGMQYRIAPRSIQQQYASARPVLLAGRKLAAAGMLHPDSNPKAYVDSVRQYALWTKLEGWNQQQFTDHFVERTRKNAEALHVQWTPQMENALRNAAPGRWKDISRVLELAKIISRAAKIRAKAKAGTR